MGAVSGVILFMDGLVFDDVDIKMACWREVLTERGVDVTPEMLQRVAGAGVSGTEGVLRELFGAHVSVRSLVEEQERGVSEHLAHERPRLRPGLEDLLTYLHDCQMPTAMVSVTPLSQARALLARARIAGFVDVVVSQMASGVAARPLQEVLDQACELLGTSWTRTIFVAAEKALVDMARTHGMRSVLVCGEDAARGGRVPGLVRARALDDAIDCIEEG